MQRMAERLLGSKAEAKDLVQDLMVELWQHRHRLGRVDSLQGYALGMTKFRCIDYLKAKPLAVPLSEMPDEASSDRDERERLFDELQRRMADLPEEDQELLRMRYWEHASGVEMGRRLEISEGNVRVRLNRIIQKLRDGFESGNNTKKKYMKKTFLLLLMFWGLMTGASAQQTHVWERSRTIDTTRHSLSLVLEGGGNGTLGFGGRISGFGVRYAYQFGGRWDVNGTVAARSDRRYSINPYGSETWYHGDSVIYQGPGLTLEPMLSVFVGGGATLHLIDRSKGSRWDPYMGIGLGLNVPTKTESLYFDDSHTIRSRKIHPILMAAFRAGLGYRITDHWSVLAELEWGGALLHIGGKAFEERYLPHTLILKGGIGLTYKF